MRVYKLFTRLGTFLIEADELEVRNDFSSQTAQDPLVFREGNRLIAVFKEWEAVVDVTEKPLMSI